jgi:EAL and modified HD-GYP domain-containing signal transduction protein
MSARPAVFDLPPRDCSAPQPGLLGELVHGWSPVIGRDQRPLGVRVLAMRADGIAPARGTMAAMLDAVLSGFVAEGGVSFPHGLVVLAPQDAALDASMLSWRAPRGVVLELPASVLSDEESLRHLFEVQRHGVRLALRLAGHEVMPDASRLAVFQYVVVEAQRLRGARAPVKFGDTLLLAIDGESHGEAASAIASGAHGVVGWALVAPAAIAGRALAPTQKSVLDLIRRVQSDADVDELEEAFKGEPVLGYMLLTLANSPAFVRATPIASLRHAITLLGYRRLVKWLVLLMVVASKDTKALPQIYCAVARGFLLENLAAAAGAPAGVQDECFVVGAFSLLGAITGQPLPALLEQVKLPDAVSRALLNQEGPLGRYLRLALAVESARPMDRPTVIARARDLNLDLEAVNCALLQALSATDALQSVV